MAAGKTAYGYGYYEATIRSSATELVNAFWMQGDQSEVNILKVENGVATVSWHCFTDQDSQTQGSYTIPGVFDVTKDHTATFHWTRDQITVLLDGKIQMQVDLGDGHCLRDTTMKPIFSVEAGETLPSVSSMTDGDSFGDMVVSYFRKWDSAYINRNSATVLNDEIVCKTPYPGNKFAGIYNGPTAPGKWTAYCGAKLIGSNKLRVSGSGTLASCQAKCAAEAGCSGLWWSQPDLSKCRLYHATSMPFANELDIDAFDGNLDAVGNVVMIKDLEHYTVAGGLTSPVSPLTIGAIPYAKPTVATACPTVSDPSVLTGQSSTSPFYKTSAKTGISYETHCHSIPGALGVRATIDLDDDGIVEFGCPYIRSEAFVNGVRKARGCGKLHQGCGDNGEYCPPGATDVPSGKIKIAVWDALIAADASIQPQQAMTADTCVKLCTQECSCHTASWRPLKKECWLLATNSIDSQIKASSANQRPSGGPQRALQYTSFIKTGSDSTVSYCDGTAIQNAKTKDENGTETTSSRCAGDVCTAPV